MRHQVPFIGERKIVRADNEQARAKRTSGRVIDDIVGDGVAESSWDDIVPAGWDDKSQPETPIKESARSSVSMPGVSMPKSHVPLKPGNKAKAVRPDPSVKSSGAYSGAITFSDSPSLDWIPINNGRGLRINIHGNLDHGLRKVWARLLSDAHGASLHEFEFNLKETPALGLTGLGMLLLFKERKSSARADIKLCNCNKEVVQLLEWTGMDKYFLIELAQVSSE